jgi:Cu/Ag efflux pump CusA
LPATNLEGGSYLDILPNRERLAQRGVQVGDVMDVVSLALGAEPLTTVLDGLLTSAFLTLQLIPVVYTCWPRG